MKYISIKILLITFGTIIFSQDAMYLGSLEFDYSGSITGSYQSGIEIDYIDFIPENGTLGTQFYDDTNMHTLITAMAPSNSDDTRFDIFFIHILTETTPEPGNYECSGFDLDGFEEILTTMLFIPEA